MKANRKFVNQDMGISAVVAMILIVALTVSLIAVAYAWINGLIPTGATASKTMQATYDGILSTNKVQFEVVSTDAGILWANVNVSAVSSTTGDLTYVTENLSQSPSGVTEVKVGQQFFIDCDDSWSGSYKFTLVYDSKIIWESSEVSF